MHAGPQKHREPDGAAHQKRARHRSKCQRGQNLCIGQRRHQIIDNRALHFTDQQREAGIGKGILHHTHDDEAGCDEICKRNAQNLWLHASQSHGENNKI